MCNIKRNEQGFTLIELVVVMVISVILMAIAGSIFLSATGFFTNVTLSDQDKLGTDKIAEFVDGEIMYATDIVVSKEEPDKLALTGDHWHYFKFEKERIFFGDTLYKDTTKSYYNSDPVKILNDSYYANRNLVVEATGYEDTYRLDLVYIFNNQKGEEEYRTKSTIAFPNLKLQYPTSSKKGWFNSVDYDSANDSYFYIYYTREGAVIPEEEDGGYKGTVADYLDACKAEPDAEIKPTDNKYKDWGEYDEIDKTYKIPFQRGDFVKVTDVKGIVHWYRYVGANDYDGTKPGDGKSAYWTRIYSTDQKAGEEGEYDPYAIYYQGDVVRYANGVKDPITQGLIYYSKIVDTGGKDIPIPNAQTDFRVWAPVYIDKYRDPSKFCNINNVIAGNSQYNYVNHTYVIGTPYAKLFPDAIIEQHEDDIYVFDKNKSAVIPSAFGVEKLTAKYIVKVGNEYYINMSGGDLVIHDAKSPATDTEFNWQKLQVKWDSKSFYDEGDIILYEDNFYRAKDKIDKGTAPKKHDASKWDHVYWNAKDKEWKVDNNNYN